jgi:hypothetical protein
VTIIPIGGKVRGQYFGHNFGGTVYDRRPHSMNNEMIYFIRLDDLLTVFGEPRTVLAVTTGEPHASIEVA